MNLIEHFFVITDELFPAKTPSSERENLYKNIAELLPLSRNIIFIATLNSYLHKMSILPIGTTTRSLEWPTTPDVVIKNISQSETGANALVIDIPPADSIKMIESIFTRTVIPNVQIIVVPISFSEKYSDQPYYSALTTLLEKSDYSIFNIYDIKRKRGQVKTAYALYMSKKLRDVFIKKIQK